MEQPGAGAAAAAAGRGTRGTPRGSWCHPTALSCCIILGPLVARGCWCHRPLCTHTCIAACTGVHILQAALTCMHTLLQNAHTHCSAHTLQHAVMHARVASGTLQEQQCCEAPLCLPSALPRCTKAGGRQSTATRPGGAAVETHGPDTLELLYSCSKRLLPHVSTRPRPHAGVSAGQSQGTGGPGGGQRASCSGCEPGEP